MSDLAIAVVLGPQDRNSGSPRYADVVAHLYVGGAGMWHFHRLATDGSPTTAPVRLVSEGDLAAELAAGFALVTGAPGAAGLVTGERDDPGTETVRALAALVADLDVAALVTVLHGDDADAFTQLPWSVLVATGTTDVRRTQWSEPDTRRAGSHDEGAAR